jgi:hypothetical protein
MKSHDETAGESTMDPHHKTFRRSRPYFAKPPLFDTVIFWNDISKCHEDDFFDAPVV